jgi:hypothetical protein
MVRARPYAISRCIARDLNIVVEALVPRWTAQTSRRPRDLDSAATLFIAAPFEANLPALVPDSSTNALVRRYRERRAS